MPRHAGPSLLLALSLVACAGKSVDLDGSAQMGAAAGGASGARTATTLVTLTAQEDCYEIAVDSQRLYWLGQQRGKPSSVRSCLKDNCEKTQLTYPPSATGSPGGPHRMRVRNGTVYWLEYQDASDRLSTGSVKQTLWACAAAGCSEPQLLVADAGEGGFEIDADEIYFPSPTGSGLLACPVSGCAGTPRMLPEWALHEPPGLEQAYIVSFLIAMGDSLFWVSNSGELMRLRKDGSLPPESVAVGLAVVTALAANESYIYWPVPLLAGSIGRCAYPTCAGGLELFAPNLRRPLRPVLAEDALLFQHQLASGDWQIASCSFENCGEPRAIAPLITGGGFPSAESPMAVDDAWVYIRSYDPSPSQLLRIQRIPR